MRDFPAFSAVVFGVLVLAGLWQARRVPGRVGAALWVTAAAAVAFTAGQFVVGPGARPSLRDVHPGVSPLFHAVGGFPAPSGAAAMAGAVTAGLFLVRRRLGLAAAGATAIMAFFQICVLAFSWQDVAAGLVFGLAIVLGGYALLGDPLTRLSPGRDRDRGQEPPGGQPVR